MALVINDDSTREDLETVLRHLSHKAGRMTVKSEDYPEIHEDMNACLIAWQACAEVPC